MALRIQAEETAKTPTPQQPANRAATTMAHRLPDPSDAPFDWAKFFDEITEKWPVLFAAEKSKNPGAQPLGQNFSAATVQSPITRSVYTSMDGNTDVTVSYFADGFKIEPTQQYETGTTRHNVACDAKDALTAAITARKSCFNASPPGQSPGSGERPKPRWS